MPPFQKADNEIHMLSIHELEVSKDQNLTVTEAEK